MIPIVDLKAQYQSIKGEIDSAVAKVLESGRYVLGEEVASFEREFARYCGSSQAVAVNSGTSALHLSLLAAGVGPGDEVVTVPFTFVATIAAIRYTGAVPVFVDIEPESYTMDVTRLETAITPKTKVILPVHLYGQAADMDPILKLARQHGLTVIEDAAQAHGAEYKGRRVGGLGALGCFSFYPSKNLGACGEGGIVVTGNPEHADVLRRLRDWGQGQKYVHEIKGFNCRMDGLQGAILGVKLRHLEEWTEARQTHARRYDELLSDTPISAPVEMPYNRHVYHIYAIRTPHRDALHEALGAKGIVTGLHYPIPIHMQPAHADLGYTPGDFPVSEQAAHEVLSLPLYPELPESAPGKVTEALMEALAGLSSIGRGGGDKQ